MNEFRRLAAKTLTRILANGRFCEGLPAPSKARILRAFAFSQRFLKSGFAFILKTLSIEKMKPLHQPHRTDAMTDET